MQATAPRAALEPRHNLPSWGQGEALVTAAPAGPISPVSDPPSIQSSRGWAGEKGFKGFETTAMPLAQTRKRGRR